MLTKILVTIAVIVGVVIFLRHQKSLPNQAMAIEEKELNPNRLPVQTEPDSEAKFRRQQIWIIAIAISSLTILFSIYLMFQHWETEQEIINVTIINADNNRQSYHAYRRNIGPDRFITIDGKEIRPSLRDRVELQPVK